MGPAHVLASETQCTFLLLKWCSKVTKTFWQSVWWNIKIQNPNRHRKTEVCNSWPLLPVLLPLNLVLLFMCEITDISMMQISLIIMLHRWLTQILAIFYIISVNSGGCWAGGDKRMFPGRLRRGRLFLRHVLSGTCASPASVSEAEEAEAKTVCCECDSYVPLVFPFHFIVFYFCLWAIYAMMTQQKKWILFMHLYIR